jgi:hypothetical protein
MRTQLDTNDTSFESPTTKSVSVPLDLLPGQKKHIDRGVAIDDSGLSPPTEMV